MRIGSDWWRHGVLYQIYPRSFCDASGDGVGDLAGIVAHLDYLEWLGIDGIWLSPIYRSPMADHGYDIADHCDVDPVFGDLDAVEELVHEAHRRDIRVLLDFVPNHTSDRHPWFLASRSSRRDPKRSWYWWRDGVGGGPPNNWLSHFVGPAWTYDGTTGQWYLHLFLPEQPDLNWANPDVADAMHEVLRFWLRRGVDGFRIDVVHAMAKDPELRDEPPNPDYEELAARIGADKAPRLLRLHSQNQPEVHDIIRGFRRVLDEFGAVSVGEVYLLHLADVVPYLGNGSDQLHLAFNFSFLHCPWDAGEFRRRVEEVEALFGPVGGWPTYTLSNHDHPRHASRYGAGAVGAAATMLLGLRGTPFLYYGEELGTPDVSIGNGHDVMGRDACRAPMRWDSTRGGGFSSATPWLPLPSLAHSVAAQADDPDSTLSLYRRLIAVRRRTPALVHGDHQTLPSPPSVFAWRRGGTVDIAINFGAVRANVTLEGTVLAGTDRGREGERVRGVTPLQPGEALVVALP